MNSFQEREQRRYFSPPCIFFSFIHLISSPPCFSLCWIPPSSPLLIFHPPGGQYYTPSARFTTWRCEHLTWAPPPSTPMSTSASSSSTRTTTHQRSLLSLCKICVITVIFPPVPNPQILGGHPRGHPWRHPCFAGNYKYLFKPFRIIQIHDKGAKSTKSNVSKHHNQHHYNSGPSDGQGRIESEQRAGLQVEVVVVVVYR